jgi:hypothetical protein
MIGLLGKPILFLLARFRAGPAFGCAGRGDYVHSSHRALSRSAQRSWPAVFSGIEII